MENQNIIDFLCAYTDENALKRLQGSIWGLVDREKCGFYPIANQTSITKAYNTLMKISTAKYKCYLHHDVEILNPNLVQDVDRIFSLNPKIGMIGFAGTDRMSEDGIWWHTGNLYFNFIHQRGDDGRHDIGKPIIGDYKALEASDGFCLITRVDIPWDERISKFHFYDISQSLNMRNAGYEIVIPFQENPWMLHGLTKELKESRPKTSADYGNYDEERIKFLKLYKTR